MAYAVALKPSAQRQLGRVRGVNYLALRGVILALPNDPRPRGSGRLSGTQGLWRLRLRIDGRPWRVVYQIDDARRLVLITRVVPRDEGTYRAL